MKRWSHFVSCWKKFFFAPIPADSLGLFRVAFAVVVLMNLALLAPDTLVWYGERGTLPDAYTEQLIGGFRINLFAILRPTDAAAWFVMSLAILAAVALLVGYRTRLASICLWIALASLHHRNLFLLNSADTLIRNLAFLLMFAPAGSALSIDRSRRILSGAESTDAAMIKPWALRLMQIQLCVMYLSTVMWKISGPPWLDGTAVYYTVRLEEFARFPIPDWMYSLSFARIMTWGTLAVELSMATLIWIPRLRSYVLFAGVMLHLGIEYSMNIPVFQWAVLASYVLFLPPEGIRHCIAAFQRRWAISLDSIHALRPQEPGT